MDDTELYIKQCEKAVEIQVGWIPRVGDYVCDEPHTSGRWTIIGDRRWNRCSHDVWLPRQDQLQEVLPGWGSSPSYHIIVLNLLAGSVMNEEYYYFRYFTSMEQLWLAFVMKEKYNKNWDGEDWVIYND